VMARNFVIAILINIAFVCGEFLLGWRCNSSGLLADAGHNLGDVGGLAISLTAFFMIKKRPDNHFTYGFRRGTILAAFLNSVILLGAVILIVAECIEKFRHPQTPSTLTVMLTAAVGIAVNGFTVWLLARNRERDLNVKSACCHMMADTLVSAGVVISGAMIALTNWQWLDPLVGLLIALLIIRHSHSLWKESFRLLFDGVPCSIDVPNLTKQILTTEHVRQVNHLHIWGISTNEIALTAAIRLDTVQALDQTRNSIKKLLSEQNIRHSFLEFSTLAPAPDDSCGIS